MACAIAEFSKPWVPFYGYHYLKFPYTMLDYLITMLPALLTDLSFKIDRDTTLF
jgi:hypothetical protein